MDISRAQAIMKTDKTIDVKHDGVPVWIDSVDASTNRVTVHVKNNPSNQKTVSAAELLEV